MSKVAKKWFSSDLHLLHDNIIDPSWSDAHRKFDTIEEHNEYIVERHNSVVEPQDTWFCLGDVFLPGNRNPDTDIDWDILDRMNGKKKLVAGNHDTSYRIKNYLGKYFSSITSSLDLGGNILLTHMPVHQFDLDEGRYKANVHGHLHSKTIDDPRYINVSMENIDYTPISYKDILDKVKKL